MKPEYKPLKEITSKMKKFKTRVRVVHKGYPQRSPKKPQTRYQRLVFEDDEGYTMKGALFNSDIEKYAEALQRKGEYELDDVTVNRVPEEYATHQNEHSMVINDRAKINPLIAILEALAPEYQAISTIPRDPDDKNLFDVLGFILYVFDTKEVVHSSGRKDNVHEVHIIDHSHDRPLCVSLWNEIITVHESVLESWADTFVVAGFLATTGRNYRGFTVSSTMSTTIVIPSEGARADALRHWAAKHKDDLIKHHSKLVELSSPTKKPIITTVDEINRKKAHNTWQEELFALKVGFPTASLELVHVYVGCSKCNRRCDAEPGTKFTCYHCGAFDAVGDPRLVFKVDAVDATGSIQLPIFAQDIQQLLGLSTLDLWTLSKNDEAGAIAAAIHTMHEQTFLIKVGPTLALTTSRVLSWAVRSIEPVAPKAEQPTDAAVASCSTPPEDAIGSPSQVSMTAPPGFTAYATAGSPITSSKSENAD